MLRLIWSIFHVDDLFRFVPILFHEETAVDPPLERVVRGWVSPEAARALAAEGLAVECPRPPPPVHFV